MKRALSVVLGILILVMCTSAVAAETVNVIGWNEPNANPELNQFLQCGEALGHNVEVTVVPESEYSSKLNQMVAAKTPSDIMIVWECDIKNFVEAGGIVKLDDYLVNSDAVKTEEMIGAVAALADGLGGVYGLPWSAAAEIMYYNVDMFNAAGIPLPTNEWTYEDFKAAAAALTRKNPDGTTAVYGCALPNLQTWWAGIGAAGDQIYDPATGELVIGEGAVRFIKDCKEMVDAGIMPAPSSDTTDFFASGMAAMSAQGSWMTGGYVINGLDFKWDLAPLPKDKLQYNTLHTGFYTISSTCSNPDLAWKTIEWLMSEPGQKIVMEGGALTAIESYNETGIWRMEADLNWDALNVAMNTGVFGYTCLPAGVTGNAVSLFQAAVLSQITPEEAVEQAMQYAAETIGY